MTQDRYPQPKESASQISTADSQTAQEYIAQQLRLEAEAKEALPYQFDTCTKPLGPLKQSLFSCLTCNPLPVIGSDTHNAAGICYSCSISCHGEHQLVELFSKRDFECDCGTTRTPASTPCNLRSNSATGLKGNVTGEQAHASNKYNQNFGGRFCGCGDEYDPHKEKGTMFQCLGMGSVEDGGCGEDWWHPECLMGFARNANGEQIAAVTTALPLPSVTEETETQEQTEEPLTKEDGDPPLPPGFPAEDSFDHMICYKCVEAQSWLKSYASTAGFLPPVQFLNRTPPENEATGPVHTADIPPTEPLSSKRKMEEDDGERAAKRVKPEEAVLDAVLPASADVKEPAQPYHTTLPAPGGSRFSLFLKEDFRDHFCRCRDCFPRLAKFPHLLEEEDIYEPPVSESDPGDGQGSLGSRSLLDRGEAALSTMDRARAIEGVMAYHHLKDNLKSFLQPFADSGQAVGAEDIKAYFAKLRGDSAGIQAAATTTDGGGDGDNRREQSGY